MQIENGNSIAVTQLICQTELLFLFYYHTVNIIVNLMCYERFRQVSLQTYYVAGCSFAFKSCSVAQMVSRDNIVPSQPISTHPIIPVWMTVQSVVLLHSLVGLDLSLNEHIAGLTLTLLPIFPSIGVFLQ